MPKKPEHPGNCAFQPSKFGRQVRCYIMALSCYAFSNLFIKISLYAATCIIVNLPEPVVINVECDAVLLLVRGVALHTSSPSLDQCVQVAHCVQLVQGVDKFYVMLCYTMLR